MKNRNKRRAKAPLTLILALAVEVLVLILILLVVLFGVLGFFLPVLPGLLLFGLAAGLYSLLLRSKSFGTITSRFHPHLKKIGTKFTNLPIIKKNMGIRKKIQERKDEKTKEEILKNGLILIGLNLALFLVFFFGFLSLSIIATLLRLEATALAFMPLLAIFIFSAFAGVVWYRFGQILGQKFKKRKILNTALVVLISVLPILLILMILSNFIFLLGSINSGIVALAFLSLILMAILSAVFEFLIVSIGVVTKIK